MHALLAFLVPRLPQSGVWKLQPLLGCAVRNAEKDSVSVLGLQVQGRNALSLLPSQPPRPTPEGRETE